MENLLALLVLLGIVAVVGVALWALARHGEKSKVAIEQERLQPPTAPRDMEESEAAALGGEEAPPQLEALLVGLDVGGADELGQAGRQLSPRQARSQPLGSLRSPLPLLEQALRELGVGFPGQLLGSERWLIPSASVAEAAKSLTQAFERTEDLAGLLERLEGASRAADDPPVAERALIEQALRGGTEMVRLTPAVDVGRLLRLVHERCLAKRPATESLLAIVRPSGSRECLRVAQGEAAPALAAPAQWQTELQALRGRLAPTPDGAPPPLPRLRAALRAPGASTFFPSNRQILYLLAGALQKAGLLFPLAEPMDEGELLFVIPGDDVDGALNTLEAACGDKRDPLLKSDRRDELITALLDLEREEREREGGTTTDAAALRAALDADRVPAPSTPALEAACAVRALMSVARDAKRHGDDLVLLHRRCDLSPPS